MNCRALLAPSGQLVALENLRGLGWMDLTFGQLDGWWRFADSYRPHHALATPAIWSRALHDAGFESVQVLGVDESTTYEMLDKGVIVAQGPAQVTESPGVWVLAPERRRSTGACGGAVGAKPDSRACRQGRGGEPRVVAIADRGLGLRVCRSAAWCTSWRWMVMERGRPPRRLRRTWTASEPARWR